MGRAYHSESPVPKSPPLDSVTAGAAGVGAASSSRFEEAWKLTLGARHAELFLYWVDLYWRKILLYTV